MNSGPERIIFYPEFSAYGGEERNVLYLCRYLHARGIRHRLICYEDKLGLARYARSPLEIEQLLPPRNAFVRARVMARRLRAAQGRDAGRIYLGGIQSATHAGLCTSSGYVLRVSDTPSLLSKAWSRFGLKGWLTRRGFRKAYRVVATTRYLRDEIRTLYGVEAAIVPVGGNLDGVVFKMRGVISSRPIRLLSVCRLEANKRVDWMIDALWTLKGHGSGDNLHLDIVGNGECRAEMEALVRAQGLGDRVTFHGFVDDARLQEIYDEAYIFLMPARQGFGMPAVEALARGIPVVLHRQSGVSEMLEHTAWAEVFDGGAKDFCGAIVRMIERVEDGQLARAPLPALPTEENWARGIVDLLGWENRAERPENLVTR